MLIKTKHSIGDEVWVANVFGEPFKVEVYGVAVEVLGNITVISYYVGLNEGSCSVRRECDVFSTKEELLKCL